MSVRGAVRQIGQHCVPDVPAWSLDLVGRDPAPWSPSGDLRKMQKRTRSGQRFTLTSLRIADARNLSAQELEEACAAAYADLGHSLRDLTASHPVRVWNFIPGILEPLGEAEHRYMVFNAGRFHGYRGWFPRPTTLGSFVPTATAVGHQGDDLLIHCLSAQQPGVAVENPRQISAYCYSERYGRLPPCFARATRLRPPLERQLLVGGTASVYGEHSLHHGDLQGQIQETFANLGAVVGAASEEDSSGPAPNHPQGNHQLLSCYRSVRVYFVRDEDLPVLTSLVESRFRNADKIEFLQADLCRPELLLEIEGVAELAPSYGAGAP